jgi:Leucine-rich repeat (LRR) protein
VDLSLLFTFNPDLEHIYLTKARISSIPPSTLANLKTLFSPEMYSPRDVLPEILEYAENLTYLDLSRTDLRFSPYDYDVSLVLNTPNLRILSLQDTHVSDESAELLSQLHSLRSLFLRGTAISTSGLRMIVYGCPWLEEVDLASCRRIDFRERRTVLANLQTEFQESLEEVRRTGQVMDPDGQIYKLQCVHNGDEERDALVLDIETRLH